jgi:haloacetate dehalogenase
LQRFAGLFAADPSFQIRYESRYPSSKSDPTMPDLADLYPHFASHWIDTSAGRIFARTGGSGPPLLLLHGYPQTNVIWHKVAPRLAQHFSLVIPDLPGYGWSAVPRSGPDHAPYTKRAMALAMIEVMEALGHGRFALAGHDRGGRVGYRLALDHPGRLSRLAVLDIVPTYAMWHGMDQALAYKVWHWTFLALPAPFPETLIGKDPVYYLDWKIASWSGTKDLSPFDPRALQHYRAFFQDPLRIHATCEDYRAGHTTDLAFDEEDRANGRMIDCPVLALWGATGIPSESGPLAVWSEWAPDLRGLPIDSGHFPLEENPEPTASALIDFFTEQL